MQTFTFFTIQSAEYFNAAFLFSTGMTFACHWDVFMWGLLLFLMHWKYVHFCHTITSNFSALRLLNTIWFFIWFPIYACPAHKACSSSISGKVCGYFLLLKAFIRFVSFGYRLYSSSFPFIGMFMNVADCFMLRPCPLKNF